MDRVYMIQNKIIHKMAFKTCDCQRKRIEMPNKR